MGASDGPASLQEHWSLKDVLGLIYRCSLSSWTALSLVCAVLAPALGAADQSRFDKVPGVVVNHRPASSRTYLGSPSIAVWTNGNYVVSHDFFGPATEENRVAVFSSEDCGRTWRGLAEFEGGFWCSLFAHRGALYLLGSSHGNGEAVIRRSTDGGRTWTVPKDAQSGLLLAGAKYHGAPVPVVVHNGRIWRAMEDVMGPPGWGKAFRAFMLSAPENSDLLVAANWTQSNVVGRDPALLGGKFGGWLEGNAVVAPDGGIVNVLRVDYRALPEKAAILRTSPDGKTLTFDAASGFVDFPGGCKKFTIRLDPITRKYWSLANYTLPRHAAGSIERTRNTLALTSSPDLRSWTVNCILLYHPDVVHAGFQYVDWQFDGDDLIAAIRTAYDDGLGGAGNCHDANFITFQRFSHFRELTLADSVPIPADAAH